ncbi:GNAT family N-acetyltransferase [Agromyces salentinus]|uniref:GNAT family N-acetyltransferase n=1 Tax=Agromyces salentinus TaxID=269421 RepID=A0ABN2MDY0_9MICO|nr:GNAT family N-acetyltransferase [Agromyces salentinus]
MSIAFDIRHLGGTHEIELFNRIPYALNDEIADDLELGRRRLEWTWLAIHEGHLLGRLALWSPKGATDATQFDIFDLDDALSDDEQRAVGAALLGAARGEVIAGQATPPEFARYLPADWRDRPAERRATETIMALLEASGARFVVERLRLEWEPTTRIPAVDRRLSFRAFEDEHEVLDLTTRALTGTLDAHSRGELSHRSPREVALTQFDEEFAQYLTPRQWWRVALDSAGGAVGFVFPARNSYHHIIAYVGVLPEYRGNGYIDGILTEGTRVLAEADAPHIRASTDVGNVPMANAFARAGYDTFQRLINMEWPLARP